MNINEIVSKFLEVPKAVALGPSSLESLGNEELWSTHSSEVAIPDNLLRLVTLINEGSKEHRDFMIRLIRYFKSRTWSSQYQKNEDPDHVVNRIVEIILKLKNEDRLLIIDDKMVDPEIQESLVSLFPGRAFDISLSPKKNFLREYLVKIYSWSKRTGGVILEKTRRVFSPSSAV